MEAEEQSRGEWSYGLRLPSGGEQNPCGPEVTLDEELVVAPPGNGPLFGGTQGVALWGPGTSTPGGQATAASRCLFSYIYAHSDVSHVEGKKTNLNIENVPRIAPAASQSQ